MSTLALSFDTDDSGGIGYLRVPDTTGWQSGLKATYAITTTPSYQVGSHGSEYGMGFNEGINAGQTYTVAQLVQGITFTVAASPAPAYPGSVATFFFNQSLRGAGGVGFQLQGTVRFATVLKARPRSRRSHFTS